MDEDVKPSSRKVLHLPLLETIIETKRQYLQPQFIENIVTFNRFGKVTPTGIANHFGGNFVLFVSGNAWEKFVASNSGAIEDTGTTTTCACVVENNNGVYVRNRVTGKNGTDTVYLQEALQATIRNKRVSNIHDLPTGQHYTELGYFALAPKVYYTFIRYTERREHLAQFRPYHRQIDIKRL